MSLNEEFDELARRKLEERQFAFQEADWQDARARIDAHRGGRGRAAWLIGAGLLLLIGSMAWYGSRSLVNTPSNAAVEQGKIDRAQQVSAKSATAIAKNTASRMTSSTVMPVANTAKASLASVQTVNKEVNVEANTSAVNSVVVETRLTSAAIPAATASNAPMIAASRAAKAVALAPVRTREPAPSNATPSVTVNTGKQLASPSTLESARPSGEVIGDDAPQDGGSALSSLSTPNDQQVATSEPPVAFKESPPPIDKSITAEPSVTVTTMPTEEKHVAPPTEEAPLAVHTASDPALSGSGTGETKTAGASAPADSASAQQGIESNGTAAAAPPAPEAAPPLVPDRAPWEISVLGGVFSSQSDYSGSNSADWTGDISSKRSISVGAEFMHMGRNIGIGTGLHYGSYAERLRSNTIDVSTTSMENFWYLQPIDTTFLFITDTLPGQPPTYVGTSVDTTVNVLTPGTNSITSTERLREARDQVNRVSYFEVPLLLDAHLVQGRWSFGLRGGPTFGLLTGTRGSIPDANKEGYVAFTDLPFREFILGYTARAYVRYRFNAAWSVGIEPAMRGQLMNNLGSGDLGRRSAAKGVMLSLSYRLRSRSRASAL